MNVLRPLRIAAIAIVLPVAFSISQQVATAGGKERDSGGRSEESADGSRGRDRHVNPVAA